MNGLKSYLQKQTTDVLTAALKQTDIDTEAKKLLESILLQRQSLLNEYSHERLLKMTSAQLVELLNSPQIRLEDYAASKTIMLDVFDILGKKAPNADIYYSKELITYLKDSI